jgi:hypothetical protein
MCPPLAVSVDHRSLVADLEAERYCLLVVAEGGNGTGFNVQTKWNIR